MTADRLHERLAELGRAQHSVDVERLEDRVRTAIQRVANDPAEEGRIRRSIRAVLATGSMDIDLAPEEFDDDDGEEPDQPEEIVRLRAEAERLGADHALALASGMALTEADARSLVEERDRPSVLDDWSWPDWVAESASVPHPLVPLMEIVDAPEDWVATVDETVSQAWQRAAKETYREALDALALRTLGLLDEALELERRLHQRSV
jgi:hypothetical protein